MRYTCENRCYRGKILVGRRINKENGTKVLHMRKSHISYGLAEYDAAMSARGSVILRGNERKYYVERGGGRRRKDWAEVRRAQRRAVMKGSGCESELLM